MSLDLTAAWSPFLQKQWEAFGWEPPDGIKQVTEGLLGGWGAGKTDGVARVFVKRVLRGGWHRAYGHKVPIAYVCAPTWRVMRQTTLPALEAVMPREAIRSRRLSPVFEWELANQVKILFVSAESEIEGFTAFAGWLDEVQHPNYWTNPKRIPNLVARLRDPRARLRSLMLSGLPESGPVRDRFDRPDDPSTHLILTGTRDNAYLDEETISKLLAACPAGYEDSFIGGKWLMPQGAIYSQYDPEAHLSDRDGDWDRPVHLGMDVGNGGAMVAGQDTVERFKDDTTGRGLRVVGEMITEDISAEEMCLRVKRETPWRIVPGESEIYTDPNLDKDEYRAIKRVFGDVRIVKRERGDDAFPIETGIRWCQRALRDAHGDVRCRFSRALVGKKHGILDGIQRYRRNEFTGRPVKDNLRDHPLDAWRYLVAGRLQPERAQAAVKQVLGW